MKYRDTYYPHPMPPESQSRQLDFEVRMQEMPYGYVNPPPPADSGNHDEYARESHKEYPRKSYG